MCRPPRLLPPAESVPWAGTALGIEEHIGTTVPAGTILAERKGTYGEVAHTPLKLEGPAWVAVWQQVTQYVELTDFVCLRRMNLVPYNPNGQQRRGVCPCH